MWARYMRKRDKESHLAYTKQRNKVKKLTRQAKKERERKIAKEVKSNPKKFWKYVAARTKTGQGISELEIPNTTDGQGKPTRTKSDKEKADVLSDTFSGVFTKEDSGEIPTLPKQNFTETLDDVIIYEENISKKLKTLNPEKYPGPDLVHHRVSKELAEALGPALHIIFKTSMDTGILPAI